MSKLFNIVQKDIESYQYKSLIVINDDQGFLLMPTHDQFYRQRNTIPCHEPGGFYRCRNSMLCVLIPYIFVR